MQMPSHNRNILFVDDSKTEINYLKLLFQLTDIPLNPSFINSAHVAIETLADLKEGDFPDIIVVDINMPLMSGFEFAEIYNEKFSKKYPESRLFIYSTSIHSADVSRAETMEGVTGFIAKPFEDTTFQNYIQPHLPKNQEIQA